MHLFKPTVMAAALLIAMPAMADKLVFEAAQSDGSVTLTLDAGLSATVVWADGSTQAVSFDGLLQELALKSKKFTISTKGSGNITTLICPDNDLTLIDLTDAPAIKDVNAQSCGLSVFKGGVADKLMYLNLCGNPELGNDVVNRPYPSLESLLAAGCGISATPDPANMPNLRVMWLQDNALTNGAVRKFENLEHLYLQNNQLTTISIPSTLKVLNASGNALTRADIRPSTILEEIDLSHNSIATLYTDAAGGNLLKYAYLEDNELTFKYMPTVADMTRWLVDPQAPIQIEEKINVGDQISLLAATQRNAWGVELDPEFIWKDEDGNVLTEGIDYTQPLPCRFVFPKEVGTVFAVITAPKHYPDAELFTTPVTVGDNSSVDTAGIDARGLDISAVGNKLTVTAAEPVYVSVSDAAGVTYHNGILTGSWSRELAPGVYIVNNTKVVVGTR